MKKTGAQIIIELLERQGVRTIAGIPGGANLPLYDALGQSSKIRHVLARHEQAAGFMAQGIARATGEVGVCFATSGPGATNILTAIADAHLDSIPVICITGQVPTGMIGTDAFQEVDVFGMSIPVVKHSRLVKDASELLDLIPRAFQIASSGRPGPVLLDIPKDVQNQVLEFDQWPEPGRREAPAAPDPEAVAAAARMIESAKKPILYLGGGINASGAGPQALALGEKSNIPAVVTLMGLGAIPSDHRLNLGMLGMHGSRYTNLLLEESDLLIAAGVRFDDRATGKLEEFCPNAAVVHIDIDASEIGKLRHAHVGIAGDAAPALEAITSQLDARDRREWNRHVEDLKSRMPLKMPRATDPCSPYGIILETARRADENAIITTDVGQHQMWAAQAYPFRRSRRWLTSGGLGTMGFGFPAAIGAALAEPDTQVICFTGDGSFLMNIQEMATAVEEDLNVKIVLMDNQALGLVHQQQSLFYGSRHFASKFAPGTDFAAIARGFGMKAVSLGQAEDPGAALTEAMQTRGPVLIHVPLDVDEKVFPMVPPGAANRDMVDHPEEAPDLMPEFVDARVPAERASF